MCDRLFTVTHIQAQLKHVETVVICHTSFSILRERSHAWCVYSVNVFFVSFGGALLSNLR